LSEEKDNDKKTSAENFAEMLKKFGQAIGETFNDPELKEKAREFAESVGKSAKTFASRLDDEGVKEKFRNVGKAAEDFGKSVEGYFKKDKEE
jgi:hypothetical protein